MAAPHSTSLRALRALSQQHTPATTLYCRRRLHITGAFSAQPVDSSGKTGSYASRTLPELKSECQRRGLVAGGSKADLVERLSTNDVLNRRAFSIARSRINGNVFGGPSETRQFNTSRASKAVNDSSTLDFVYMPSIVSLESQPASAQLIPILGENQYTFDAPQTQEASPPMKPQIYAVSETYSDMSASPMSEVVDNHALEIDPFKLTETVGRSRAGENEKKLLAHQTQKGIIGELFTGMMDDLWSSKATSSSLARK